MADYLCEWCLHRFESLELRAELPDTKPCEACGELAINVIGAPKPKKDTAAVHAAVGGKSDPHLPHQLDTRPLAEGMPLKEWKAKEKQKQVSRRYDELKQKGLIRPKVYST